jgi:hypothetical protein
MLWMEVHRIGAWWSNSMLRHARDCQELRENFEFRNFDL